jgi:hypothetical protein
MKYIVWIAGTSLLCLSMGAIAQAQTVPQADDTGTITQAEQVETDASLLLISNPGDQNPLANDPEQFNDVADQINQQVTGRDPSAPRNENEILPDGMVIRGTQAGAGLQLGTDF